MITLTTAVPGFNMGDLRVNYSEAYPRPPGHLWVDRTRPPQRHGLPLSRQALSTMSQSICVSICLHNPYQFSIHLQPHTTIFFYLVHYIDFTGVRTSLESWHGNCNEEECED